MSTVNMQRNKADNLKNEIVKKGYWEITLRPEEYHRKRFSFDQIRDALQTCQVRYRGWYYPHISDADPYGEYYNANNYVQSWVRYAYFAEIFRFYTSGQFVHYAGMYEDWKNDTGITSSNIPMDSSMSVAEPEKPFLEPIGSLYLLTEIFLFASRLAKKGMFGENVHITIKLHNQEGRILKSEDPALIRWWSGTSYTKMIDVMDSSVDAQHLYLDYDKMAVDKTAALLGYFNCSSKDLQALLESDQKRIYQRAY